MKHAFEIGSVAMMYIPIFIKIGSGFQKFKEGRRDSQTYRDTNSMVISRSTFIFSK
jgi:hypothetical protein